MAEVGSRDGEQPTAAPASADDSVLPFRAETSGVTGRVVRLGPLVDEVLAGHDYPPLPSEVLGQGLVLTAMLGTALKFGSRLTLQTQTDGAIGFLVVDYQSPGRLRGYASFDSDRVASIEAVPGQGDERVGLLGCGRLAMTIDPGPGLNQYQGLVPIDRDSLELAALQYFRQSEQLPTFIRLAVARHYDARTDAWTWRAGGLMLQYLTDEGGKPVETEAPEDPEAEPRLAGEDDENWERTRLLAETVEDHELLDPNLTSEQLLYRLFHEEGVRVYPAVPVEAGCSCTRERIATMLQGFEADALDDMRDDTGRIVVKCEFCSSEYAFTDDESTAFPPDTTPHN